VRTQRPETHTASEQAVGQLLVRIASLLLRLGIDAPSAQRLLRTAFVLAATDKARRMPVRTTQSRIASMAGISRLEVRSILSRSKIHSGVSFVRTSTRIEKVTTGWRTDPLFLDSRGRARSLVLRGSKGSFEHLAKKYGRDVTSKSLRDELVQRGIARLTGQRIHLTGSDRRRGSEAAFAESDLKSILLQLGGIDFGSGSRAYAIRHATVASYDLKTVQMLKGIATRRIDSVLNSMAEMSSELQPLSAKKTRRARRLLITAMIATESEEKQE